jgi:quercetin dioxygenase-like cupin family protein
MRQVMAGVLLLGAGTLIAPAIAQPAQSPPAVTRTVVASAKLPSVVETPQYFRAMQLSLPSRQAAMLSAPTGILYQLSGSTEITVGNETKVLRPGDALFLPARKSASLKAGDDEAATLLHFLLTPAPERNKPEVTVPLSVKELYRTAAPIPDLKPGAYDLNLTRVTFPPQMPTNPPHHRSGAALYYVVSGTGSNTVAGRTETKPPGSLIYEPFDLVHQWGNGGDAPFTFLAFNINPEGMAAVLPGEPAKPH